ncbi:hypothetical protein SPRG_20790 [Saprolegnia parasitica CBS 223.65]|uniref:CID domain-containing protein n=1 Tax=Saprolegnia parasitica (strain CBS 223.65) TaxID=695850 RepID=A0A067CFB6_SAPPC|nr:hypothetical protein SPRG_20790 [Saprolegnia parasitica CBS 223.65]KDO25211.1 hypothetical protein SPRG_20790 [Saprolegnia parasitica CBS 223.65]|eukprot:XP_012204117.1 hypothetical protein SPRG_20790 [Saprolegnia parasitica CBS 223.65]
MGDNAGVAAALAQYDETLNKLGAYPAKPIINNLTMIAENLAMAKPLATFLVSKLHGVVPAFKLPILYLMDSILKNVGGPYVQLLGGSLPPVFKVRLFPENDLARMRAAADAATRVAQPTNQPTSFAARPAPAARPAATRPAADDMQLRLLLTNLQNEEGIHPAQHMSLEDVRMSNPAYYAQLLDFHKSMQHQGPLQQVTLTRPRSPPRQLPQPQRHAPMQPELMRPRSPRMRPMAEPRDPRDPRDPRYGNNPRTKQPPPRNVLAYQQRPSAPHQPSQQQQPLLRRPVPAPSRSPPLGQQPPQQKTTAEVMMILQKLQGITAPGSLAPATSGLKFSDIQVNKRRIDANIYLLYEGLPFVCAGSGVRFANEKQLSEHMDFLFQYNRAQRERTKGGNSRPWYPDEEQWATDFCAVSSTKEVDGVAAIAQQEAEVDKDVLDQARVPVDEATTKCRICGEQFSKCWDDDEEEWMYQNAVRGTIQTSPPKETIFHKYCYDSVVASSKLKVILPSQLAPGSPLVTKRGLDEANDESTMKRLRTADDV